MAARRRAVAALCALAVLAAPAASAWAQANECPSDGGTTFPADWMSVVAKFPFDSSMGVPTDGFIRLRYRGPVPRPVVMQVVDENRNTVAGDVQIVATERGEELHWQSREPLRPNTRYTARYRDLMAGEDTLTFTTGAQATTPGPIEFSGITRREDGERLGPSSTINGSSDICGDPNAVTISVQWRRARSNGWPASDIEYVVYQTAGPGIGAPVVRARERVQGAEGNCPTRNDLECLSFRLPSEAAGGQVCFNIQAIDAYGRNDGNAIEACVDPTAGNYFVGANCDASQPAVARALGGRRRGGAGWLGLGSALALLAVGLAWRVRRTGRFGDDPRARATPPRGRSR